MKESLLRAANLVVALAALILLLPVMLIIALLIKLDSPGAVIYRQRRIGYDRRTEIVHGIQNGRRDTDLGGRPFTIYKFRTMREDAEHATGPVWASRADARATRVGKVLRRTRLDEIPQFWNVLMGDMSVVGPRPERPDFVLKLREEIEGYQIRHTVKPGITGWAQVNRGPDRSTEDVREKIGYDLEYIRKRSLWMDLQIILKTLPVLLEGHEEPSDRSRGAAADVE